MSSFVPVQPLEVERLIQKLPLKTSPLDSSVSKAVSDGTLNHHRASGKCFLFYQSISTIDEVCHRHLFTKKGWP